MTISEMIATLENIRHEYGDIQIDGVRKDEDDFIARVTSGHRGMPE